MTPKGVSGTANVSLVTDRGFASQLSTQMSQEVQSSPSVTWVVACTCVATGQPGWQRIRETSCSAFGQCSFSGRPVMGTRGVCHSCFPGFSWA